MLTSMTWWMEYNKLPWFPFSSPADQRIHTYRGHNNNSPGRPINHLEGSDPQLAQGNYSASQEERRWASFPHVSSHCICMHMLTTTKCAILVEGGSNVRTGVPWGNISQEAEWTRTSNFFRLPKKKGPRVSDLFPSYLSRHCYNKEQESHYLERF